MNKPRIDWFADDPDADTDPGQVLGSLLERGERLATLCEEIRDFVRGCVGDPDPIHQASIAGLREAITHLTDALKRHEDRLAALESQARAVETPAPEPETHHTPPETTNSYHPEHEGAHQTPVDPEARHGHARRLTKRQRERQSPDHAILLRALEGGPYNLSTLYARAQAQGYPSSLQALRMHLARLALEPESGIVRVRFGIYARKEP